MFKKRLPIGIQNFEGLIKDGYCYIDKTGYIYDLAYGEGKAFFLSRPRRFGKSLFLSTLRAYYEGKKGLFAGLEIERLEADNPDAWKEYPVFFFDFNKRNYKDEGSLENILGSHLEGWEEKYGLNDRTDRLEARFQKLLEKSYEQTGKRAVILVDEYDKPLLDNDGTIERMEHDKAVLKGFFSTLKSYDEFIHFSFLTGVTKFSKVSIFSDLNHLVDITVDARYASIAGITEQEMKDNLDERVELLAENNKMSKEECYAELKRMYDGYHFHQNGEGVYNPFSLFNALSNREFGAWWFETGTPTFLVEKLKSGNYDIRKITDGKVYANEAKLKDYRDDNPDPVPVMFQTGYLTIKDYDIRRKRYTLSYPNEEVKYGFLESLAPLYLNSEKKGNSAFDIYAIDEAIEEGDTDRLKDILISLYANLPYTADERPLEQNFQNVAYLVFMLLGQFVRTEVHSAKGRSDVIVETDDYVYIMEFKRDDSADAALAQIEEKGYALPYTADKRQVIRIGANFDSESRTLDEWKVE